MDESVKVFKLPDGKGGTKYQIMTPDGEWLDTDENGTVLSPDSGLPESEPPKLSRRKKKPGKSSRSVFMSVQFPQEDYDLLSKYVYWHSLHREPVSRSGLAYRLLMETIRRDREFQSFLKK